MKIITDKVVVIYKCPNEECENFKQKIVIIPDKIYYNPSLDCSHCGFAIVRKMIK